MHRYQPRVHLVKWREGRTEPVISLDREHFHTYVFPETVFTAVTAYQNQLVSQPLRSCTKNVSLSFLMSEFPGSVNCFVTITVLVDRATMLTVVRGSSPPSFLITMKSVAKTHFIFTCLYIFSAWYKDQSFLKSRRQRKLIWRLNRGNRGTGGGSWIVISPKDLQLSSGIRQSWVIDGSDSILSSSNLPLSNDPQPLTLCVTLG